MSFTVFPASKDKRNNLRTRRANTYLGIFMFPITLYMKKVYENNVEESRNRASFGTEISVIRY